MPFRHLLCCLCLLLGTITALAAEHRTIETEAGLVYTGFLLADGERLVVKDTLGKRYVIERGEVASRRKQDVSPMPDDLAPELEAQDLADLRAFLLR